MNIEEHIQKLRVKDPKLVATFNRGKSGISVLRGKLSDSLNIRELRKAPFDDDRMVI